jgi:Ca2+-binding RTX toxin-like protein
VADGGAGNDRFSLIYPSLGSKTIGGAGADRIEVLLYGSVRLADESIRWDEGRTNLAEIERATIMQIDTSGPVTLDATRFSGSTWLYGGPADDVLLGGTGPDHLYGLGGNDTLQGGGGPDLLDGSRGRDTCDGGRGRNRTRDCERTS